MAKFRQPSEDFLFQQMGETQEHPDFPEPWVTTLPLAAGGSCDRQMVQGCWRAVSLSLGSRWREVAAPQLGGICAAAAGSSVAQHTPEEGEEEEEEKEEEEEAATCYVLHQAGATAQDRGPYANSGMSHARG